MSVILNTFPTNNSFRHNIGNSGHIKHNTKSSRTKLVTRPILLNLSYIFSTLLHQLTLTSAITVGLQDTHTGNWMLMFGDKYIGYWPKAVVPGLADGAAVAAWGGEVYSPTSEAGPAMGSGHFPEEGFKKSAFVNQIQVVKYTSSSGFVDPDDSELSVVLDRPICFGLINKFTVDGNWGRHIFFGGPSGCK